MTQFLMDRNFFGRGTLFKQLGHFLCEVGACLEVGGSSKGTHAPLGDFLKITNILAVSIHPDKQLGPYGASVG